MLSLENSQARALVNFPGLRAAQKRLGMKVELGFEQNRVISIFLGGRAMRVGRLALADM
jgi:hypothetical protein